MKRNVIIASIAAAGVVGGAVLANSAFADDHDSTPRSTLNAGANAAESDERGDDDRDDVSRKASQGSWVSAEQAVAQALKAEPGLAYGLELEEDDRVWEVDILTKGGEWRQVDIARKGGDVVDNERDDDDDDDRRKAERVRSVLDNAKVSLGDAARIANERVPGTIEEIELSERGTIWKVEFEDVDGRDDDVELRVDISSGKATVEDDDDDDDRGDRDDDRDDDDGRDDDDHDDDDRDDDDDDDDRHDD